MLQQGWRAESNSRYPDESVLHVSVGEFNRSILNDRYESPDLPHYRGLVTLHTFYLGSSCTTDYGK